MSCIIRRRPPRASPKRTAANTARNWWRLNKLSSPWRCTTVRPINWNECITSSRNYYITKSCKFEARRFWHGLWRAVIYSIKRVIGLLICLLRSLSPYTDIHRVHNAWLSYGVVCVILGLAIFVELRLVTDRQTDGRTDGWTYRHTMTAYCDAGPTVTSQTAVTPWLVASSQYRATLC